MAGNIPVSLRMDEEAVGIVDSLAKAHDQTRSDVMRSFIHGSAPQGGVWVVAYYGEGVTAIFATEIEALRFHAKGFGQFVKFWPWGERPEDF